MLLSTGKAGSRSGTGPQAAVVGDVSKSASGDNRNCEGSLAL